MPRNNDLPSYESLLEFQEVYFRAIALCWNDSVFKEKLTSDSEKALEDYFGYKCPWNINVTFKDVPKECDCNYDSKNKKWNHFPKTEWKFGVPATPEMQIQPIALAAYNDAGPTYLFTCC